MVRSARRTIFCILSVFAMVASTLSVLAATSFEQANTLYEQGKFQEAAAVYEGVIKSGRASSAVFFNLGNAYFKDGQLGRALMNYRMSERLDPRDPDVQAKV